MVHQTIVTKVIVRSLGTPRRVLIMSVVIQPVWNDKYECQFNGVVSVSTYTCNANWLDVLLLRRLLQCLRHVC